MEASINEFEKWLAGRVDRKKALLASAAIEHRQLLKTEHVEADTILVTFREMVRGK